MRWFVGFIYYEKNYITDESNGEAKHDAIIEWDGQNVEDLLKICNDIVESKKKPSGLKWLDKLSDKLDKLTSRVHVECLTRLD